MKKTKSYKIYVFFFLLVSILLEGIIVKANQLPLVGHSIYLDPGHGGRDPGTIYNNIYEEDINLEICFKIKEELEKNGALVFMTRYGDYDLSYPNIKERKKSDLNNRAKVINNSLSDMYISIHLNSIASKTWYGAQAFYDDVNPKNKKLANMFQKQFQKDFQTPRKVKEIKNMLLNRKVKIPGVLLEVGFLSNDNERYLLQQESYQKQIAKTIAQVLLDYYSIYKD